MSNFNIEINRFNKKIHEKIANCSNKMIFEYPYYSEILLGTNMYRTKSIPTMGVNATTAGFNFYYNDDFIDTQEQLAINFIIVHEIYHLLFDHPARTKNGGYEPALSNIAQDMIINTILNKELVVKNPKFAQIPQTEEKHNMGCFIPKEYNGKHIFEDLYAWLVEQRDKLRKEGKLDDPNQQGQGDQSQQGQGGQSQGQGQGNQGQGGQSQQGQGGDKEENKDGKGNGDKEENKDGKGNGDYGPYGKDKVDTNSLESILKDLDNDEKNGQSLDSHLDDTVPPEMKKQMVRDLVQRVKARGLMDGSFEDILGQLQVRKKDYLKEIKRTVSSLKGSEKYKTWMRYNRRNLPLKGVKKLAKHINCILDTSGSMHGYFEKIVSYIFQNNIIINLIQCDTRAYDLGEIKNKKDLKKMKLHGLGGTTMEPAISLVREKYNKLNTVLLTDGGTEALDLSGIKGKFLVLSVDDECPISALPKKSFKQIIIRDD